MGSEPDFVDPLLHLMGQACRQYVPGVTGIPVEVWRFMRWL
jgi:hypothetical protein